MAGGYMGVCYYDDMDMGKRMSEPIVTTVIIAKIQTMADGGIRLVFDALETDILQAAQLMECKRTGVAGMLTFEPIETIPPYIDGDNDNE